MAADAREAETRFATERYLQMIDQLSQLRGHDIVGRKGVQAEMIEARFQVHRIDRRNPRRRPVACLAPDTQSSVPILGTRFANLTKYERQQLRATLLAHQVRTRQPALQPWVAQAPAAHRRQNDDGRRFVI